MVQCVVVSSVQEASLRFSVLCEGASAESQDGQNHFHLVVLRLRSCIDARAGRIGNTHIASMEVFMREKTVLYDAFLVDCRSCFSSRFYSLRHCGGPGSSLFAALWNLVLTGHVLEQLCHPLSNERSLCRGLPSFGRD